MCNLTSGNEMGRFSKQQVPITKSVYTKFAQPTSVND